jgi:hypothetical protein
MRSYPLNAWYAAAYDVEVQRELLARTVGKQPMVLYRQGHGAVAMLEDACCRCRRAGGKATRSPAVITVLYTTIQR